MPKEIIVDPSRLADSGSLSFPDIRRYGYARSLAEERAARGDQALRDVLRHMLVIREFETMLGTFKAKGAYRNIPYVYKGPAHLSVGQEAAAVGAALALEPVDHIFGSHRSHGEFIAKGLSAIARLPAPALAAALASAHGGRLIETVARVLPADEPRKLAEHALLFGLLAEIFMRSNGFNGGMGGSMHAFFLPFGAYPNNAIVGASAGIATGAALFKKLHGEGIAVAMAGDGSTGCGPVFEAMNFAAMAQFRTLWTDARKGGLPVLFFFTNNFYAMGGQTIGETMGWDRLARIGAGVNPEGLHAETVDGTNPLAVADAVSAKRALLLAGNGPALLDVECYRLSGHSTTDANAYRTREEIQAWEARDPVYRYGAALEAEGIIEAGGTAAMAAEVGDLIGAVTAAVVDAANAPPVNLAGDPMAIGRTMLSFAERKLPATPAADVGPLEASARIRQDAKKARFGLGPDGAKLSAMRAITLRDGLFEAILHHLVHDEKLIAYGEECRDWGGAFGVYRGLAEILPHQRVFNSPISEAAIVATAVGYAMEGGRALVELMYGDFMGRAGDEIFNQMAKWQAMSAGALSIPVVLRLSVGSKYGAQHSQDWTAMAAHVPGLKVVYPATPHDAKGLMASALAGEDPVVFFESQRLYDQVELFEAGGVPADYYRLPLGVPATRRAGRDVTILTIGPSLYPALEAAGELDAVHGVSAEVIDARTLVPFDYAPLIASLARTGRLLIVSEAVERGSFAMTIAANVTRFAFAHLKAAPRVLGTPNWIVPGADMEQDYFPQPVDIVDAVLHDLTGTAGDRPRHRAFDDLDLARRGL